MHPAIPLLLELQKTDNEIAALRANLETAPKRIRENDAKLNGARSAVAAAKDALAQIVATRKKTEFEVSEWRERAKKFRSQTSAVKTNEAYKALLHEIANAEAEMGKLEDVQLEQMMSAEEAEKNVKASEAALRQSEQSIVVNLLGDFCARSKPQTAGRYFFARKNRRANSRGSSGCLHARRKTPPRRGACRGRERTVPRLRHAIASARLPGSVQTGKS